MNDAQDSAAAAQSWLASLSAGGDNSLATLSDGNSAALALLAAEAVARERSLLVVTIDNGLLNDFSDAVDLALRPLCLVLPDAAHATRIAVQATLSLLSSRLARSGDDSDGPAWAAQRRRLARAAALWQRCLDWNRHAGETEPWPPDLPQLFPVRVLPLPLARQLGIGADWVVIVDADRQPEAARTAWPGAMATLLLTAEAAPAGLPTLTDANGRLRAELEVLTQELSELELELATAQAEIAGFSHRYHDLIGSRMATLDALQAELAARRAAADPDDLDAVRTAESSQARAERSRRESERFAGLADQAPRSFSVGGEIKKLYRKLAQQIHPDRASDEDDRAWRTQLMTEANRAYGKGDERALREVLALWQEGGPRRPQVDEADLAAQVERLKRRVAEIAEELNRLFGSKLYELFTAANIARRAGRDLLQEMADRVDQDIAAANALLGNQP
jgi:polyhydroxyalkanoate synthesis regulator phasin